MLCYNCFCTVEQTQCPYCGYDANTDKTQYPYALPHGSMLAKQYMTGRVLGQGGFGITYLAWDTHLKRYVAIKEFFPVHLARRAPNQTAVQALSKQSSALLKSGVIDFLQEAKTLSKFRESAHIVNIYNYFEENNVAYFTMEYLPGISMKDYIKRQGGSISWQQTLSILTPVMEALGTIHKEGLIHRDVTPDNICISNNGHVKLLDFGSARYSMGEKSLALDIVLKKGYAPIEQYASKSRQGPYTDIYSLAACFYGAITGILPPEASQRTQSFSLPPMRCNVPPGLEAAIQKALHVQSRERYQRISDFSAAINQAIKPPTTTATTITSAAPTTSIPPPTYNKKLLILMICLFALMMLLSSAVLSQLV